MKPKVLITVEGYECSRCKHKWIPRNEAYPKVCPSCKSPYWDKTATRESPLKGKKRSRKKQK